MISRKLFFISTFLTLAGSVFAEDAKGFSYSLKVDGAYYVKSDYQKGETHFAKPTGPFNGILTRGTWSATYTLPTPLGENALLSGANIKFKGGIEVSPLTLRPLFNISFTPFPFFVLDVGTRIGTGWNALGFEGFCEYKDGEYKNLTPFAHYYHDHWVGATFQFDFGEVFKGDWNHVVMMANYRMIYQGITGIDKGKFWAWQNVEGYVNGLGYEFISILGYKMPLFVDMVGVMADLYGQYSSKDYGEVASTYGKFMNAEISAFAELAFNEKNTLMVATRFSSRRSFTTDHKKGEEEPHLIKSGREWYFDCIILSWTRKF